MYRPHSFISAGVVAAAIAAGVQGITTIDLRHYDAPGNNSDGKRELGGYGGRTSIAQLNRHTGKPHEHKREISRRMVQEGNRLFREDMRKINAA